MPIDANGRNVVNLYNRRNNGVHQQQTQTTTNPVNSDTGAVTEMEVHVAPSVYRQYLPNMQPLNLSAERANDSEDAMHEIYEIDRVAFAETDPYESYEDFKDLVARNNLSAYVVRDDNNSILGYYQLEPVKNGDLYIDSMGLKPEYRNSRKGYQAIKFAWQKILDKARENNAQTLSLHVDSSNRNLVRMYQSLGFTIAETYDHYYENGTGAYFMTRPVTTTPVPQEQTSDETVTDNDTETGVVSQQEEVSPEEEEQQPDDVSETSEEEIDVAPQETPNQMKERLAREEYSRKFAQAKEELQNNDIDEETIDKFLPLCDRTRAENHMHSSKDIPVFDDDRFEAIKYLINFEKAHEGNSEILGYEKEITTHSAKNILDAITVTENGKRHVKTEYLPFLETCARYNCNITDAKDFIEKATVTHKNGNGYISWDLLNLAQDLLLYKISSYQAASIVSACRLAQGRDSGTVSDDAISCVKSSLSCILNKNLDAYDLEYLLLASTKTDKDNKVTFDRELFEKLKESVTAEDSYNRPISLAFKARDMHNAGVDLRLYMNLGDRFKDRNFDWTYQVTNNMSYDEKDNFRYKAFNACCYEGNEYKSVNGEYERVQCNKFDYNVYEILENQLNSESPDFEISNLPDILSACKTKKDVFSDEKFNPEVYNKALILKQNGVPDRHIAELIEACKLSNYSAYSHELRERIFSDEIFDTALEYFKEIHNQPEGTRQVNVNNMPTDKIICSKYSVDGQEYFNRGTFEALKPYWVDARKNYSSGDLDFFYEYESNYKHYKAFNLELFKAHRDLKDVSRDSICEKEYDDSTCKTTYKPSWAMINAYKTLKEKQMRFTKRDGEGSSYDNPMDLIVANCMTENGYNNQTFDPCAFKKVVELIDKGFDGRDILDIISSSREHTSANDRYKITFNPEYYDEIIKLIDGGMSVESAASTIQHYKTNKNSIEKCIELYNMGIKHPSYRALTYANGDDLAYARLKDAINRKLLPELIGKCKENGKFKDRIYKLAVSLQDRGYTPEQINELITQCFETKKTGDKDISLFSSEIYNHIADLEELGIKKENISTTLEKCKSGVLIPEIYEKVSELHHKGFDDKGVIEILKHLKSSDGDFDAEAYEKIMKLTSKIATLRDISHNDGYIVERLWCNREKIANVAQNFGEDVMNNVLTQRIDGYVNFTCNCDKMIENTSEEFLSDLKARLAELPSPELKVKRLRVLSGIAGKVDEKALRGLTRMIKSPQATDGQVKLANQIFTDGTDYESRVERFIEEMKVPPKSKKAVREYLMKERLDKQVNYPKPIEEQQAQMDIFAQQMLTNPKIPLDKKIKYIDEFKAKKADMAANPQKYTTPEIFPKPMNGLKKVITAYVNIPNDDAAFNGSITVAMYNKYGIEPDEALLSEIHYDSKYFDKLLSPGGGFSENFQKLITLKQLNPEKKMNEILLELPEEGTSKYEQYNRLGLIEQIKANLDTKRQLEEQGIDFEKWNSFDENLKGETFTVEADSQTEYKNVKYNIINIFQDELFEKIKQEETDKLKQRLSANGYTIFNNKIYYNGSEIPDENLEHFTNVVKNYIENNDYWKSAAGNGTQELSPDEIEGINGFTDHLNGAANRIKEIQGARTVNDIYFRLADENDIGRNIFFGNHVGCCNSVDSNYAGFSAPLHLMNSYNRGLELVDRFGNSYGNSRCFFAMVDGKLSFIIDSMEANGKLGSNPVVTENMIKFGKQVCRAMGCPDAQVMVGPNHNNIDTSRLHRKNAEKIKVLGTISIPTYCDVVGGKTNIMDRINNGAENKDVLVFE